MSLPINASSSFRLIEMVVIDYVCALSAPLPLQMWNESWVGFAEEDERWYYGLAAVTFGAFGGAAALIGECGTVVHVWMLKCRRSVRCCGHIHISSW